MIIITGTPTGDVFLDSDRMVVTVVGKDYMGEILHCSACGHEWYEGMNKSDECDWCNEGRETGALTRFRHLRKVFSPPGGEE